jgi:hypothetical protein
MNRQWVTLAFGITLVFTVAVISVWQNYPGETPQPDAPPSEQVKDDTPAAPAPPRRETMSPAPQDTPPAPPAAPKVDARLPVVHKHRFGDCEGTLRAVPGTLSYATAHEDDGFRLAFAEIEAFELDAEKKNLRIRRRGGKTWNFTTRGDDAAALSTFHKEATRARK